MKWICSICGCVVEGDGAPGKCPVCNAPAEAFSPEKKEPARKPGPETGSETGSETRREEAPTQPPAKRVCSICGYLVQGAEAPDHCPICNAPGAMFS